ncbi:MAG: hypothetical protein ACE5OQ_07785 [Woeseia sp.]
MAVVLALITFLVFEALAEAAGLLGLWLLLAILPAYFRYLLYLLEARAHGRDAPVPGIELFNWVENFWTLPPLVLVSFLIWGEYLLMSKLGFGAAAMPGVLGFVLCPASMAVLALTRSPLESLNPAALIRVAKACGPDYVLIPASLIAAAVLIWFLVFLAAPYLLIKGAVIYASFLMFTMTGRVLGEHSITIPVEMPPAREPDAAQLEIERTRGRTRVLDHAYGFISRGNRQGGLRHLYRWIDDQADRDAAYRWFFDEMLQWESKDPALFLAQKYVGWLLSQGRDTESLKLIGRCLLEDPRFRPLPEDIGAALAAAERSGNLDLVESLRR